MSLRGQSKVCVSEGLTESVSVFELRGFLMSHLKVRWFCVLVNGVQILSLINLISTWLNLLHVEDLST